MGPFAFGMAAIVLGAWRGWLWVRNPWFRGLHLLAIAVVPIQALAGVACPLTVRYTLFGLTVLAAFAVMPPRRPGRPICEPTAGGNG